MADGAYRDAIGWPTPRPAMTLSERFAAVRDLLAERRRAREVEAARPRHPGAIR